MPQSEWKEAGEVKKGDSLLGEDNQEIVVICYVLVRREVIGRRRPGLYDRIYFGCYYFPGGRRVQESIANSRHGCRPCQRRQAYEIPAVQVGAFRSYFGGSDLVLAGHNQDAVTNVFAEDRFSVSPKEVSSALEALLFR